MEVQYLEVKAPTFARGMAVCTKCLERFNFDILDIRIRIQQLVLGVDAREEHLCSF